VYVVYSPSSSDDVLRAYSTVLTVGCVRGGIVYWQKKLSWRFLGQVSHFFFVVVRSAQRHKSPQARRAYRGPRSQHREPWAEEERPRQARVVRRVAEPLVLVREKTSDEKVNPKRRNPLLEARQKRQRHPPPLTRSDRARGSPRSLAAIKRRLVLTRKSHSHTSNHGAAAAAVPTGHVARGRRRYGCWHFHVRISQVKTPIDDTQHSRVRVTL
jgi:hypothetical protein